jgi:hypothetical protein
LQQLDDFDTVEDFEDAKKVVPFWEIETQGAK